MTQPNITLSGSASSPIVTCLLGYARPTKACSPIVLKCVNRIIRMSSWAVCFSCIHRRDTNTTKKVSFISYYFQMIWITTGMNATKMVQYHIGRYWSFLGFVHQSVNVSTLPPNSCHAITVPILCTIPYPARRCFFNTHFKSFRNIENWLKSRNIVRITVSFPSGIMFCTQKVSKCWHAAVGNFAKLFWFAHPHNNNRNCDSSQ